MKKSLLCGLSPEEILQVAGADSFTSFHAVAAAISVYKKRLNDISLFTNIPRKLREKLSDVSHPGLFKPVQSLVSADRTEKFLFRNADGLLYETVYIPENKRHTVCVSAQSGCRLGCPLCVTGKYGFHGNLSAGEMVNQVVSLPGVPRATHVVFMGMGEPLDNTDNVMKACTILTAEWGLALSPRNITVSTVGIREGVIKFLENSGCNLTLSLHSPFPEEREKVVPAERRHPALEILNIMKNFPLKRKRRLSVAYVMIRDVNDTGRHLEGLKKILRDSMVRVNLLPYHSAPGDPNGSSSIERMQFFKHELVNSGISASIRKSRGEDISAACGLLASGLLPDKRT